MIRARLLLGAALVALLVGSALVTLDATFTALCGSGTACAYIVGDKFGYQTVDRIRTNFNDHESRLSTVEGAYISAGSTTTLTNKTLNAESTGNVLTLPFTVWWPAATCEIGAAYSAEWQSLTASTVGSFCEEANAAKGVLEFADSGTVTIFHSFKLPTDWTSTIDVKLYWYTSATSGNVVWQVSTGCVGTGDAIDPTFNAAQTITDAAQGTTNKLNIATLSSLTTTGCAVDEEFYLKLSRDPAHASDTIGAAARFTGLELTYRRAI